MKTILLIILYLISSFSLYSQRQFIEIKKEEEVKGKNNTYIKIDFSSKNSTVYNKNYELIHREEDPGRGFFVPLGRLENKRKIHEAIEKYILPYVEKYINDEMSTFTLGFVSELDGMLKEVTFYYPTEWNIPITVLEDLENTLLNSAITLSYDRNNIVFQRVTTVLSQYAYGKNKFTILRDQGARGIIDEEDLIRVPEEGGLTPLPGDEKPITDPDDRDSNPIHDDKDIGPVF